MYSFQVVDISTDDAREFYMIHVGEPLEEGYSYKVRVLYFRGVLHGDLRGIYYSSYDGQDGEKQ